MANRPFVDYYEVLQLSPNASAETLERVYRLLAKRFHPDNSDTGDADRFAEISEAFQILSHDERRAKYDVTYEEQRGLRWQIVSDASSPDNRDQDRRISRGILALLYTARRRDPLRGGLGSVNLERMLGCPQEHLAFPLWYLKERGLVERLDNGQFAITVDGIDRLGTSEPTLPDDRLLHEAPPSDATPDH